jgi:hypothetical protein
LIENLMSPLIGLWRGLCSGALNSKDLIGKLLHRYTERLNVKSISGSKEEVEKILFEEFCLSEDIQEEAFERFLLFWSDEDEGLSKEWADSNWNFTFDNEKIGKALGKPSFPAKEKDKTGQRSRALVRKYDPQSYPSLRSGGTGALCGCSRSLASLGPTCPQILFS